MPFGRQTSCEKGLAEVFNGLENFPQPPQINFYHGQFILDSYYIWYYLFSLDMVDRTATISASKSERKLFFCKLFCIVQLRFLDSYPDHRGRI